LVLKSLQKHDYKPLISPNPKIYPIQQSYFLSNQIWSPNYPKRIILTSQLPQISRLYKNNPMCDGTQKSIYNGIGSRLMVKCHAKHKIYVNICIHVAELSLILFENCARKFIFPIYFSAVNMKNCTKWKKVFCLLRKINSQIDWICEMNKTPELINRSISSANFVEIIKLIRYAGGF